MHLHGISTMTPLAHQLATSNSTNSPGAANGTNSTNSTGPTGSSGSLANQAANDAESTFISLLVTELQSQDPTQPMDPTQMVGQMFSMNQLQQLISINQTLTAAFPPAQSSSSTGSGSSAPHVNTGAN